MQSTKPTVTLALADVDTFPEAMPKGTPTHACYTVLMESTGQTYMDLTGKFVAASSNGNDYILVIYNYDSNAILVIPLKNRQADLILNAYKVGHA